MSITRLLILSALAFGIVLLVPTPAEACSTYACQLVDHPTIPFCLQCVDTGSPTGASCFNTSVCGCRFQQCLSSGEATMEPRSWRSITPEAAAGSCPDVKPADSQALEITAAAA
ncbi:MAG: hypothetical protein SX243_13435 [Acidobacteriota bacterium]|nr:hypothetical protein [Acidobacteriota bacterium]